MSTQILRPNAAGNYATWDKVGDTSNYLCVDEVTADDATTYVKKLFGTNGRDSYNVDAWAHGDVTINSVKVYWRALKTNSAGNHTIQPFLRLSSTDSDGTSTALTASYADYNETISRPGGGGWTYTDLANLEAGINALNGVSKNACYCTQVYIEVDYTEASGVDVTPTAISLVTNRVSPTVVKGSITIAPAQVTLVVAGNNPSVAVSGNESHNFWVDEDGVDTDWTPLTGTDHYAMVDDSPQAPDDASTYIYHDMVGTGGTNRDGFKLSARPAGMLSGDPIVNITVHVRGKIINGSTTDKLLKVFVKLGSNYITSSTITIPYYTWTDGEFVNPTRPGGGGWTCGDIDTLEIGVDVAGQGSNRDMAVTQVYLEIEYTPSPIVEPVPATLVAGVVAPVTTKSDWPLQDYIFRREITFPTALHGDLTTDDTIEFEVKTGEREILATNGSFNEAIQESGFASERRGVYTHVVYLGRTGSDGKLGIFAVTKNHGTGEISTPVRIDNAHTAYDTHHFPTMCIDNDNYIHVFYGCHNDPTYYARSTNPNDTSAWDLQGTFGSGNTYPMGFVTPSDGRINLICRSGSQEEIVLYYSTDGGDNWSSAQTIIEHNASDAYRVYCYGCRLDSNERLHLGFSYIKTGNMTEGTYYIYSDYTGSGSGFVTWKDIAGTTKGTIESDPVHQSDGCAVIENEANDQWISFCRHLLLDSDNSPIVILSEVDYYEGANSDSGVAIATWNGSTWDYYRIAEEHDMKLRVGRCGCQGLLDRNGVLHLYMPIAGKFHLHHKPTSDGYHTNIGRSAGDDNFAMVDDGRYKHDSDATYLINSGAAEATFLSTETINNDYNIYGVGVEVAMRDPNSNANIRLILRIDGTDYDYNYGMLIATTLYKRISHLWKINPATSQPWTKEEAEQVEFGFKQTGAGSGLRVTNCVKMISVGVQSDDEFGSSEIIELTSDDDGNTWDFKHLTMSSQTGVPIVNVCHRLVGDVIEMVWTSGHDVFLYRQSKYGKMRIDARDLRIIHAGVELDRIIDYADHQSSKIRFRLPENIASGEIRGDSKIWLVYGSPNVIGHPQSDPNIVHPWGYDGFEEFDQDDDIDGVQGWTVSTGAVSVWKSPPEHSNKVGAGEKSAHTASAATVEKSQTLPRSNIYVEGYLWCEESGGDIYLALVDAGGDFIAIGLKYSSSATKYYDGNSWITDTDHPANSQNMLKVAIALEGGSTMSVWMNNARVANSVSVDASVGDITKVKIVTPGQSYFDEIIIRKQLLDNVVELLPEESRGIYVGATISGQGEVQVNVNANIDGTETATGQALLITATVAPTTVQSSLVITPAQATAVTGVVDPGIILTSIVITPAVSTLVTTGIEPMVILPSMAVTPASTSVVTNKTDPVIIKGSISLTPAVNTLVTGIVTPSTILGSTTATPASNSLIATIVNPVTIQGSTIAMPNDLILVTSVIAPAVIKGSITITPAVSTIVTGVVVPVLIMTSTTAIPGAASYLGVTIIGSISCGDIDINPPDAIAWPVTFAPMVLYGDITTTPTEIMLVTGVATPTVIKSSITLTPATSDIVIVGIDPNIVMPSMIVTPNALTCLVNTFDPVFVAGSINLSPAQTSLVTTGVEPTVILPSMTVTPTVCSLITASSEPNVLIGDVVVTPTPATAVPVIINPTIQLNSINYTPSADVVITTSVNPVVIQGNTLAIPAAVTLVVTVVNPTVFIDDLSLTITPNPVALEPLTINPVLLFTSTTATPSASTLVTGGAEPTFIYGSVTVESIASCVTGGGDPSVTYGSVMVQPVAGYLITGGVDAGVVFGSLAIIAYALELITGTAQPNVVESGIVVTPQVITLATIVTGADVVYSSLQFTPTPVFVIVTGDDPAVGGVSLIIPPAINIILATVNPNLIITLVHKIVCDDIRYWRDAKCTGVQTFQDIDLRGSIYVRGKKIDID